MIKKFWNIDSIVSIDIYGKFSRKLEIVKYIKPGTILRKKSLFKKEKIAGENIYQIEDNEILGVEKYISYDDVKDIYDSFYEPYFHETFDERYELNPEDNEIYFKPYIHLKNVLGKEYTKRFSSEEELELWKKSHSELFLFNTTFTCL